MERKFSGKFFLKLWVYLARYKSNEMEIFWKKIVLENLGISRQLGCPPLRNFQKKRNFFFNLFIFFFATTQYRA